MTGPRTLAEWDRRLEKLHARAITLEALNDLIRQRDTATAKAIRAEKVVEVLRRMVEYPTPLRVDIQRAVLILAEWDRADEL